MTWGWGCFCVAILLAARFFFLSYLSTQKIRRLADLGWGMLCLLVALLFVLKSPGLLVGFWGIKSLFLLGLTLILGIPTLRHLYRNQRRTRSWIKRVTFILFFLICFLNLTVLTLKQWNEDHPVLKLTLTGLSKPKWMEWKNPYATLRKEWVDTYEVILEDMEGNHIGTFYISGQLVGIRAKVLRFSPWLNFFGIHNVCQFDLLYNGYKKIEAHSTQPHEGFALTTGESLLFSPLMWSWWEKLYTRANTPEWVKAANLESCYFPLTDPQGTPIQKSYLLTITEGGLSALP